MNLKRIKLFRARARPVYNIVAFEESHDILEHDPLKISFEYAQEARTLAGKIQDFTAEYCDIASKCEDFAKGLLDKCTTKHEVQTLLQTRDPIIYFILRQSNILVNSEQKICICYTPTPLD